MRRWMHPECQWAALQAELRRKAPPYGMYSGSSGHGREAAELAEAAENLLTEARRLPPSEDADAMADTLAGLQRQLNDQAGRRL